MPKDTKARAQEVARELFRRQGLRRTSLQEIADRLGITKPALYYHFSSRDDLVRSIVQPFVDDGDVFVDHVTAQPAITRRAVLEGYFDLHHRHREVMTLVLRELIELSELGLVNRVLAWRDRLRAVLVGPDASLADRTRATVALGGLTDCVLEFHDEDVAELRVVAVDAACAALGP
ncbi:TetR/AcrR family transcriptional regulator [Saccharothrix violaceirubra]|uniref:AcrR family transcriptional regulator n=1 Tax=Saccharothrix violaceirubra TaxID=413306 RepID=A0A7W7WX97_9PSEU|nr:TetR/AcrR family transcriptional regulator [Saccharothrix violaceirubra]MBB4967219.1 AcrR family transcriptional regulator [Saccharothrix violaceirubra]